MVPDFNPEGLLPPGIHLASRDEFRLRFGVFSRSDRRIRLHERFDELLEECCTSGIVRRVFVGGSYVTNKPDPNDFDCLIVLDPEIVGKTLPPFQYNLVHRRRVSRRYGADVIPVPDDSPALNQYLSFFQTTRDGLSAGLVEVLL